MDNIVTEIVKIIYNNQSLIEIEMDVETYFTALLSNLFSQAMERIDLELIQEYKEEGYEIDRIEKRTVQFSHGPVELKRRRMRKRGEKSVVPLDAAIGLEKYKRYSPLVEMKAVRLASDSVYRKAAEAMELLTPLSISHGAIHSMTQGIGEKIQNWTDEAPLHDERLIKDKKKVPILFIEGDGLLLKGPEEKRPELHRVQIHEGVIMNRKRPELKNPLLFESTESSQKAFERAGKWIEKEYDLRNTIVISNSDGGSGYERDKFDLIIGQTKRHEHFRDAYHVNRKVKERLSFDKKMANLMIQAIRLYDQERIQVILQTTLSRIEEDEKETDYIEAVVKLEKYIQRNWESIKPLKKRHLPNLKGLGVCESNHRPFSYRMKRQGRGFSKKGAGNLAAVISARRNKTFFKILTTELPAFKEDFSDQLKYAVRNALKKVKAKPSVGAVSGRIVNYGPTSSPIGRLAQIFR
ncbi:MAG: ISLre2 family transposase [Tetragenococcus koreensis]|nr:ISLre2 family transposase [Tetragenococcus koreensis]MDN6363795.1 ISLre2 family transposase [Tetragenococcus koreensis]